MSELLHLRVRSITYQAEGIQSYELVDPSGAALVEFDAGSHIDVHTPVGLVRQYSLCNAPVDRHRYVIGVLREDTGRGGSRSMHEQVHVGDMLTVSHPRNNFPLIHDATHYLLVAGGIGMTPLLAMIETLRKKGASFTIHFCTRSPDKTPFQARLHELAANRLTLHHDGGDPERGLDVASLLQDYREGTHLYCCGPAGLMAAVADNARHWSEDSVHFEYFASVPSPVDVSDLNGEFSVTIASTGQTLAVPQDKSILQVLSEHNINVESSCEAGVCGTCRTRYLRGTPLHRDFLLTEEEQENDVLICCARSKTAELVLDL